MLNLRREQLVHDSKLPKSFVPNNSANINHPVDFEYDIVGSIINTYKLFGDNEIQLQVGTWGNIVPLTFHIHCYRLNLKTGRTILYSQKFDISGNPIPTEGFYDTDGCGLFVGAIPKRYHSFAKKSIQLYKEVFPQKNYNCKRKTTRLSLS